MFSVILSRYLAKLDAADSADEISGVIEDFLLQFDIYMFSAALLKNTRLENDDVQWMSNTTQAHFEEYMSENRIHDDYGIRRNATGNDFTPFFIGDEFVSETPDILDNEIDFYKYNASLGYRSGVAVPLKMKVEGLPAGFSLWSEMNKAQFERLICVFRRITWIS